MVELEEGSGFTAALAPHVGGGAPLPLVNVERQEHWRHFDNSVNAVSFGFVATAILISMFLFMAIFERLLRPTSGTGSADLESHLGSNSKLPHPSPKMSVYANGVSVLMPGDNIPTFIAHPAPVPCPPSRIPYPPHHAMNFDTTNSRSTSTQS